MIKILIRRVLSPGKSLGKRGYLKSVDIVFDDGEGRQAEEEIFVYLGVIVCIGELFQHLVGDKNLNISRGVPR